MILFVSDDMRIQSFSRGRHRLFYSGRGRRSTDGPSVLHSGHSGIVKTDNGPPFNGTEFAKFAEVAGIPPQEDHATPPASQFGKRKTHENSQESGSSVPHREERQTRIIQIPAQLQGNTS